MKHSNLSIAIALILSIQFTGVKADDIKSETPENSDAKKETKKQTDNSVFELGEMIIKGEAQKKLDSRDILSSVDIMNADKIENQNVLTAFDLFHRMPGVQKLLNSIKEQQRGNYRFVDLMVKEISTV